MEPRLAPGPPSATRLLGVALRTAHLAAMAVLVGGAWQGVGTGALYGSLVATTLTGVGLMVLEASHGRHWVYQVRGLSVLAHVGLVALSGTLGRGALMAALVVGAVGSHLPKALRAWSVRHGAVVD